MNGPIALKVASRAVALGVLYGAQTESLVAPKEALETSYEVEQRSRSSAAGKAVSTLRRDLQRAPMTAQLVRKDQDMTAEAERLIKAS